MQKDFAEKLLQLWLDYVENKPRKFSSFIHSMKDYCSFSMLSSLRILNISFGKFTKEEEENHPWMFFQTNWKCFPGIYKINFITWINESEHVSSFIGQIMMMYPSWWHYSRRMHLCLPWLHRCQEYETNLLSDS